MSLKKTASNNLSYLAVIAAVAQYKSFNIYMLHYQCIRRILKKGAFVTTCFKIVFLLNMEESFSLMNQHYLLFSTVILTVQHYCKTLKRHHKSDVLSSWRIVRSDLA